ncbi:TaqI-like C-terminal specificity domain-containing protein [Cetobacterium sp. 2A]|uniref:Eco57I restriction-modification methylase domain-containing protein n=1 Tax=Cetobacterium sp. 2A TaxID=2754723 RepID=UPI00351B210E
MEKEQYNYKIYTPYEFAINMIKFSLEKYFKGNITKENLESVRILDLSCGTGNLLLVALEELLKYSKEIYGEYRYNSKWIKGYDIDKIALETCRSYGKEILKKYGIDSDIDILEQDSLYLETEKRYDIVLGNPPYLGEKNNKELFHEIKKSNFGKKYYESKMDYFYFFIEKGMDLLKQEGILSYLTTNYWLKADSATKLRDKLKQEGSFLKIENFEFSLFKTAVGQHNIIFSWIKGIKEKEFPILEEGTVFWGDNKKIYNEKNKIILAPEYIMELNENINRKKNCYLGEVLNINQGIVTGHDEAFVFDSFREEFRDYLKPFYKNKDVGKYKTTVEPPFWILYLDRHVNINEKLNSHLEKFKDKLIQRREAKIGKINWWELQWARDKEIFCKPKIVVRQRCKSNNFAYDDKEFYGSADIYYMTGKSEEIDLFYILGYLNSSIFYKWFKYNGKIKGKNLEFYSTPLKETPIFYSENIEERNHISSLVKEQIKDYNEEVQKEIDLYFYKLFGL